MAALVHDSIGGLVFSIYAICRNYYKVILRREALGISISKKVDFDGVIELFVYISHIVNTMVTRSI